MNWYKNASTYSKYKMLLKIANDAKDVIFTGDIRQTPDGFVYVDVPNSIFDGFLPLIGGDEAVEGAVGAQKPPVNEKHYDIGAHITVIKSREIRENGIVFKDVGKKARYMINGISRVDGPDGWNEVDKVWFITVLSPDLEKLRSKYNLTPRIKDHDFHITVAVKPKMIADESLI